MAPAQIVLPAVSLIKPREGNSNTSFSFFILRYEGVEDFFVWTAVVVVVVVLVYIIVIVILAPCSYLYIALVHVYYYYHHHQYRH